MYVISGQIIRSIATALSMTLIILIISVCAAYRLQVWLDGDLSSWVQAIGAVLAIVVGFETAAKQTRTQQKLVQDEKHTLAQAAHLIAYEALETATGRLEAALTPADVFKRLSLQGDRTTEMILAMREFDTSQLPSEMLSDFIRLRSHVFAINERISDIRDSEETGLRAKRSSRIKRTSRLESTVRVHTDAEKLFVQLQSIAVKFGATHKDLSKGPHVQAARARLVSAP